MKKSIRFIILLLVLCTAMASLSSCMTFFRLVSYETEDETEYEKPPVVETPVTPESDILEYTLTEKDGELFDIQLQLCRTLSLSGDDIEAADAAWEELEAQFYHITTQSTVAYILYCIDQSDEALSDAYLFSSELSGRAYADYMELCREIDESASPYREVFFSDWTENEIEEMRLYRGEIAELQEENDRILVEYRELGEKEFDDGTAEYYLQTVQNLNRIAALQGYDDYYAYANEKVYLRDYGAAQTAVLRANIVKYFLPLYEASYNDFYKGYGALSSKEQTAFQKLCFNGYDTLSVNYVQNYLTALPEDMGAAMNDLFTSDRAVFAVGDNSYEGAFTATLYEQEEAVCYFGPGYQDSFTVIHELGHYYAAQFNAEEDMLLDLAEVHSQGNEMLFSIALQNELTADMYAVLTDYMICDLLSTIIICSVVDEFEMLVYQNADKITNPAEQLDMIMDHVLEGYGGAEYFCSTFADAYAYWRYVTIESPVYYISYAVSAIVSVQLYAEAKLDFDNACEIYRHLVEEPAESFLGAVSASGLDNPFSEGAFIAVKETVER